MSSSSSIHHLVATMNVKILIKLFFSAFLFFFIVIIVSAFVALPPKSHPSSPLPRHIIDRHHRTPPSPPPTTAKQPETHESQYQVFHIKNATPFFLDRQSPAPRRHHRPIKRTDKTVNSNKNKKRFKKKKSKKGSGGASAVRPFSVMLPKGLVPPSGSSPACHNDKPDLH